MQTTPEAVLAPGFASLSCTRCIVAGMPSLVHQEEQTLPAAPWEPRWTNSIAFCVSVKNENVTDIREWLRYHRCARHTSIINTTNDNPKHNLWSSQFACVKDGNTLNSPSFPKQILTFLLLSYRLALFLQVAGNRPCVHC